MTLRLDMSAAEQAKVFAVMLVCGWGMGAAYDVLAAVCRLARGGRWMQDAADCLCGLMCGAVVIAAGLCLQAEIFRGYVFAAIALGMGLYALTMGTAVRLLGKWFLKLSNKAEKS